MYHDLASCAVLPPSLGCARSLPPSAGGLSAAGGLRLRLPRLLRRRSWPPPPLLDLRGGATGGASVSAVVASGGAGGVGWPLVGVAMVGPACAGGAPSLGDDLLQQTLAPQSAAHVLPAFRQLQAQVLHCELRVHPQHLPERVCGTVGGGRTGAGAVAREGCGSRRRLADGRWGVASTAREAGSWARRQRRGCCRPRR